MAEIVTAVYENGMLRPLQPLNLQERQTVRLQIMPEEPATQEEPDKVEEVIQSLVASGLMRPRPRRGTPPPDPVSEEERRRLADRIGKAPGKPLSEIIIEERGEW
jgi:predicted DNA-binding antitoxin AbrB/MazE fold protein